MSCRHEEDVATVRLELSTARQCSTNMSEKNCMVQKRKIRVKWYKIIFSCRHPLDMSALPEGDGELNRALLMEFKWPLFLVFKINKGKNEGFSRQ